MPNFNASLVVSAQPAQHTSIAGLTNRVSVRPASNPIIYTLRPAFAPGGQTVAIATVQFNLTPLFADGDAIEIDGVRFTFRTNAAAGEVPIDNADQPGMIQNLFNLVANSPALSAKYFFNYLPSNAPLAGAFTFQSRQLAAEGPKVFFNGVGILHPPAVPAPPPGSKLSGSYSQDGAGFGFFANKPNMGVFLRVYVNRLFGTEPTAVGYFKFPKDYNSLPRSPLRDFSLVATLEKFNVSDSVSFDVSGILAAYTQPTPPPLDSFAGATIQCPEHTVQYGVEYGEFYDAGSTRTYATAGSIGVYAPFTGPVNPGANADDQASPFASLASLPARSSQGDIDAAWPDYWRRTSNNTVVNTLARALFQKTTHPAAREFIYFYLYDDNNNTYATLRYSFVFVDGTTLVHYEPRTTFRIDNERGGVFCAEVSAVNYFAIETAQGSQIDNFTVQVVAHQLPLTFTPNTVRAQGHGYKFTCDRCSPQRAQLVYLNSLGGFSTLWCSAYQTLSLKQEQFAYERTVDYSLPAAERSDSAQYSTRTRRAYKINAGLFSQAEYRWHEDLFSSNMVFASVEGGAFFRCRITGSDFALDNFDDNVTLTVDVEESLQSDGVSSNI